jgi:hypothetical protein
MLGGFISLVMGPITSGIIAANKPAAGTIPFVHLTIL